MSLIEDILLSPSTIKFFFFNVLFLLESIVKGICKRKFFIVVEVKLGLKGLKMQEINILFGAMSPSLTPSCLVNIYTIYLLLKKIKDCILYFF